VVILIILETKLTCSIEIGIFPMMLIETKFREKSALQQKHKAIMWKSAVIVQNAKVANE
jgi:hypothetical protein